MENIVNVWMPKIDISICFHGCDASVFVLLDFTLSFKVTVP